MSLADDKMPLALKLKGCVTCLPPGESFENAMKSGPGSPKTESTAACREVESHALGPFDVDIRLMP